MSLPGAPTPAGSGAAPAQYVGGASEQATAVGTGPLSGGHPHVAHVAAGAQVSTPAQPSYASKAASPVARTQTHLTDSANSADCTGNPVNSNASVVDMESTGRVLQAELKGQLPESIATHAHVVQTGHEVPSQMNPPAQTQAQAQQSGVEQRTREQVDAWYQVSKEQYKTKLAEREQKLREQYDKDLKELQATYEQEMQSMNAEYHKMLENTAPSQHK